MKFKVGERVAVYLWDGRFTAVIEHLNDNGSLDVKFDNLESRNHVHPKQCRRLVKKPKKKIWIDLNFDVVHDSMVGSYMQNAVVFLTPPLLNPQDFTEFVEVRKKK